MLDKAAVKIISALGINIQPALTSIEALKREIDTLNSKVAGTKLTLGGTASVEPVTAQQAMIQSILKESTTKQNAIINESESKKTKIMADAALARQRIVTEESKAELLTIEQALAKEKLAYMQARSEAFSEKPNIWLRHLSWLGTGFAIYEGLSLLKQGIVDVETGMKGLSTVLPEVHENQEAFNKAEEDAINLMQKYGENIDDVMTSARSFGRMYKDEATVMGLVNNSILMNVVDRVELTDAVRGNEAALAVYGKGLKDTNEIMAFSNHTMDAWTRLSHETMASATDLINITERASGAAKVAKTNFDQMMGVGSSAIRATGLPGANIGNMLKSVFAQLAAPTDKVEEKIEAVGVKMRDTNGQLRSAYDILLDLSLATKDATVSQEELANAELAASSGKFQYAKTAALMGQFDEIVKNTARSINNQGMTLQMAGQQMDTVDRKAEQLKATLIDMFSGAGDSGLRTTIKGLIDVLNQFLMGLNKVSPEVINFGLALLALKLALNPIQALYERLLPLITTQTIITKAGTAAIVEETVATEAATVATAEFSMATAVATGGITLIVGALAAMVFHMGSAEKAQMDLTQAQKDNMALSQQRLTQFDSETSFLDSMVKKREELTNKINSGTLSEQELTQAQKDLTAIGEAVGYCIDDETKKRMASIGIKDNEISKIIELINTRKDEVKLQYQDQIEMSQRAINGASIRIAAYQSEIASLQALENAKKSQISNAGLFETMGMFLNDINPFAENSFSGDTSKIDAANKKLKDDQKILEDNKKLMEEAQSALQRLSVGSSDIEHVSSGGGDDGTKKKTDAVKTALDELGNASKQAELENSLLESSFNNLAQSLEIVNSEYDYLSKKVTAGTATSADYARMQQLVSDKTALLTQEQAQLNSINAKHKEQIDALTPVLAEATAQYEQFKDAGDFEHMKNAESSVSSLQGEIDKLSSSIASNTQKIWQNKTAIDELANASYTSYYQNLTSWMQHMESLGELTNDQQLELLNNIDKTQLAQSDAWKVEESIYKNRQTAIKDELDAIKDAYDAKKQAYEDEIEANEKEQEQIQDNVDSFKEGIDEQIAAIQKLMDALDTEGDDADRESALKDHNEKIADLESQLAYEQVRTGIDHLKNIKDLNQQMDDENRSWAEKQADWKRADQKQTYQDQIDALNDQKDAYEDEANKEIKSLKSTNDKKKSEMETYYNKIQDLMDDKNTSMLTTLSMFGDSAVGTVQGIMERIKTAIQNGDLTSLSGLVTELQNAVSNAKTSYNNVTTTTTSKAPTTPTKTTTTTTSNTKTNTSSTSDWFTSETAYLQGLIKSGDYGQKEWANQLLYLVNLAKSGDYGQKEWARAQAKEMGVTIPQAHTGAYVGGSGLAELLKGERVLDPQLTLSFDRLALAINRNPGSVTNISQNYGALEAKLDRLISVIGNIKGGTQVNGPAVNVERASFEDRADMQAFGTDVRNVLSGL